MKRYLAIVVVSLLSVFCGSILSAQVTSQVRRIVDSRLVDVVKLIEQGRNDEADKLLAQMETLDPDNDAVQYYKGYIAVARNDARGALAAFSAAYKCDSTNVTYLSRLAYLHMASGRPAMARKYYEELLERRPYDVEALAAMSDLALRDGDFAKSDSLLVTLENLQGKNDYTELTRIELMRQSGRHAEFFSAINEYLATTDRSGAEKRDLVRTVIAGGDPRYNVSHLEELTRLVNTCVETSPADTAVARFAVGFYSAAGRKDAAIALCNAFPDDVTLTAGKLSILMSDNRYTDAVEVCDKLLGMTAGDKAMYFEVLCVQGDCYQRLGMTDKCLRAYEKAMKINPNSPMLLNNYAYYMACMGRNLPKCERMSRKVISVEGENPTYLDTYAYIMHRMKKYEAAKTFYKKALLYGGKDHAEILDHYADTLEALGDMDTAKIYRQKAMLKRGER